MAYQLTENPNLVLRLEDGATVPCGHRFWDEYEAWLAAGNTPSPVEKPDGASNERHWRDAQIARVRWLRERHIDEQAREEGTTLTEDMHKALLDYLQALRDWPQSMAYPDRSQRPVEPQWLAVQLLEQ
ncbi:phage tail assembly chaperone [Pseudomonas mosselii]|uniref:Phage tail assembly chaperone n=1 Tax=Pseudomonas mosselii TaxID=78327 RepID=A0ABX9B0B4_9PSED|nr:phage tail assembly chaperone [Pseudomonas mosselii]MCL8301442.1 phage tail assembly chaperone [Pseudomonas mosselii]MCL8341035.1 phage tail assembly chaperone [Pseudomonas mosselii]MCU9527636.1 phage tail assembly chaperone [Pseudomonas mosselii]MCU9536244.1 phage tail assembly chaperone [Pseudomonas mosselii]MCU9540780.1 phage tail assembly chaperone [Pseudomonas mosselii]